MGYSINEIKFHDPKLSFGVRLTEDLIRSIGLIRQTGGVVAFELMQYDGQAYSPINTLTSEYIIIETKEDFMALWDFLKERKKK